MRPNNAFLNIRNSNRGQTAPVVILFILVLGLAGFSYYLFTKHNETLATFTEDIENQQTELRDAKDAIAALAKKVNTHTDSISEQSEDISRLRSENSMVKMSMTDLQKSVKKDIDAIKSEATKNQDTLIAASSKVQFQLDNLVTELKSLKATQPPVTTPVIEVNLEPQPPAPNQPSPPPSPEAAPAAAAATEEKPATPQEGSTTDKPANSTEAAPAAEPAPVASPKSSALFDLYR